jgi:hypothetical protein
MFMCGLMAGTTGCAAVMGNKFMLSPSRSTTVGQELIDLEQARKDGVITQAEFDATRQVILDSADLDLSEEWKDLK